MYLPIEKAASMTDIETSTLRILNAKGQTKDSFVKRASAKTTVFEGP